jgi:sirohydrochlorin cobaltochelatase
MSATSGTTGVILFAHGARDPRWAEPFRRVAARVRDRSPGLPLEIAFLEFMAPDLGDAARTLAAQGVRRIHVVPLFFGQGGHVRAELPQLTGAAMATLPGVSIEIAPAAGEDDSVVDALARYALQRAGLAPD